MLRHSNAVAGPESNSHFHAWLILLTISALLALPTPAVAVGILFFDHDTRLDLDMDGTDDVQALSDYKGGPGYKFNVDDWVKVLATESFNLMKLDFDWQISAGHRHKGLLPLPNTGLFVSKNAWSSSRLETFADFNIDLTITNAAGESNFVKSAEAHEPFPSLDAIFGAVFAAGGTLDVGGAYAFADDIGGPETPVLSVTSEVTDLGGGLFHYTYSAHNDWTSPLTFNWTAFKAVPDGVVVGDTVNYSPGTSFLSLRTFDDILVSPGASRVFYEFTGPAVPLESHGTVEFILPTASGSQQISFFAPMIQPVPEPSTMLLFIFGGMVWGVVRLRRGA